MGFTIIGMFLGAWIWKLLWNHALAALFHSSVTLTYWQAFGLVFALNLLINFIRAIRK